VRCHANFFNGMAVDCSNMMWLSPFHLEVCSDGFIGLIKVSFLHKDSPAYIALNTLLLLLSPSFDGYNEVDLVNKLI